MPSRPILTIFRCDMDGLKGSRCHFSQLYLLTGFAVSSLPTFLSAAPQKVSAQNMLRAEFHVTGSTLLVLAIISHMSTTIDSQPRVGPVHDIRKENSV